MVNLPLSIPWGYFSTQTRPFWSVVSPTTCGRDHVFAFINCLIATDSDKHRCNNSHAFIVCVVERPARCKTQPPADTPSRQDGAIRVSSSGARGTTHEFPFCKGAHLLQFRLTMGRGASKPVFDRSQPALVSCGALEIRTPHLYFLCVCVSGFPLILCVLRVTLSEGVSLETEDTCTTWRFEICVWNMQHL